MARVDVPSDSEIRRELLCDAYAEYQSAKDKCATFLDSYGTLYMSMGDRRRKPVPALVSRRWAAEQLVRLLSVPGSSNEGEK